ncbi:alpha-ketoglutarate-dependent dioxygenase AlkB [Roseomonas nepalensis]|uniref:Alpha-ketoglutarate-dependent dioxygenase AlkB n=1 Tax=Muricoccus nepalensis TaxID=1854500 RepID=A0A502GAI2_9PROT|nr:alpha-ketoglutarate-dependent dioxygenase AlkB [Roseomonas nepalensis]TPG58036.1 alpha-ketoglutarate-dependent dioxygenase AlkB [Roseomonas nepalensis]
MKTVQPYLFEPEPSMPEGFRHTRELITPDQEHDLVAQFAELPFAAFEFREYVGKRRIVSYGSKYDFGREQLVSAEAIPEFLLPLRARAAAFAELDPFSMQQVLVTEYAAGAAIGWHRDKAVFKEVVGVSFLSPCTLRLRRETNFGWKRAALTLEPRSAYLLAGTSRTEWEHSIPPVDSLRYSVTFRTMRLVRG